MKKNVFLIFIALSVLSCSKKETTQNSTSDIEVIDLNEALNNEKFESHKYYYDGHIIKLETTEDCLIDYISKIVFGKKYLYIKTLGVISNIYIFDYDGKYINKLNIGNGRGEVVRLQDITYDDDTDEFVVGDDKYLKFYTPEGEFIREQEFPYYYTYINNTKDGYVLQCNYALMGYKDMPDATIATTDKKLNINAAYLNLILKPTTMTSMPTIQYDPNTDITTLNLDFSDTIYHLSKNKLEAKYVLDYSSKEMDKTKANKRDFYIKELQQGKLLFLGDYIETSTHQYIMFDGFDKIYRFYRDKKSKKIIGGIGDVTTDFYPGFGNLKGAHNDYFVNELDYLSISHKKNIKASDFLSQEDVDKINNMKEDDNPLLIFFKLKEFNDEE